MSLRYGVLLIPEPSFTATAYRARQIICGQYGSWAAEMHMLHLTLTGFFQCSDSSVDELDAALAALAEYSRRSAPQFSMSHHGVVPMPGSSGNISLDFGQGDGNDPLQVLQRNTAELLEQTADVEPEPESPTGQPRPHVPLMQYANLPPAVFSDALEFARGVVEHLQLPEATRAWRLLLVRFRSEGAGDDWGDGRWAADLSWELLHSYSL